MNKKKLSETITEEGMNRLFFLKSVDLLMKITAKNKSISFLNYELKMSYAHIFNLINEFQKLDLVYTLHKGRTKLVWLTKKGLKLQNNLKKAMDLI